MSTRSRAFPWFGKRRPYGVAEQIGERLASAEAAARLFEPAFHALAIERDSVGLRAELEATQEFLRRALAWVDRPWS